MVTAATTTTTTTTATTGDYVGRAGSVFAPRLRDVRCVRVQGVCETRRRGRALRLGGEERRGEWEGFGGGRGRGGERGRRCFRRLRDEIIRRKRAPRAARARARARACLPARARFSRERHVCAIRFQARPPVPPLRALGRGARHAPTLCCNLCAQPGGRGAARAAALPARSAERARQSAPGSPARAYGPRRDMEMRPAGGEGRGEARKGAPLVTCSRGTLCTCAPRTARARAPQPKREDGCETPQRRVARAACPTHPAASAPRCSATARFPSSTR